MNILVQWDQFRNLDMFRKGYRLVGDFNGSYPSRMSRTYQVRTRLYIAQDLLSRNRLFLAWHKAGVNLQGIQDQPTKASSTFSSPVFTVLYERETKPLGSQDDRKDPVAIQFHIPDALPGNQLLLWTVELWRRIAEGESESNQANTLDETTWKRVQKTKISLGTLAQWRKESVKLEYAEAVFQEPCYSRVGWLWSKNEGERAPVVVRNQDAIEAFREEWRMKAQQRLVHFMRYKKRGTMEWAPSSPMDSCNILTDSFLSSWTIPRLVRYDTFAPNTPATSNERLHQLLSPVSNAIPSETHLIIFVHGILGSALDFRKLRNLLQTTVPQHLRPQLERRQIYLLSKCNEIDSLQDISQMARFLVDEILDFVARQGPRVDRISFVSHSLGGLVTRAALADPRMVDYLPRMRYFISLASPHLGMKYNQNVLLEQVMAMARRWKKSTALSQLLCLDAEDRRQTFLYRLSQQKEGFDLFDKVFLVASPQDRYVPNASAVMEMESMALNDTPSKGSLYVEMLNHVRLTMRNPDSIIRIQASFDDLVDSEPLGRAAHVRILQDANFLQQLLLECQWFL